MKKLALALTPPVLLVLAVFGFVATGDPVPTDKRPPVEELAVRRVQLEENLIRLHVMNDGPDPVTIAQVLVNEAYWTFEVDPSPRIERLGTAVIEIEYPWDTGDDQEVTVITSSGVTIQTEIPAAVESPPRNLGFAASLAWVGFLIGVVPVLIGLLWFPFVKTLGDRWYQFLIAISAGLLAFLGVESVEEGLAAAAAAPTSLNAVGVFVLGLAGAALFLFYLTRGRGRGRSESAAVEEPAAARARGRLLAFTAALGIGLHNFGEGLAVGSAYAGGNVALGATFVVGFMVHNVTEGLPIIAPIARRKAPLGLLLLLGLLAGAPAIPGTWIGGYASLPVWTVLFFGIGAGAIFQVVVEIAAHLHHASRGNLFGGYPVTGFVGGLIVMYATGLLIAG